MKHEVAEPPTKRGTLSSRSAAMDIQSIQAYAHWTIFDRGIPHRKTVPTGRGLWERRSYVYRKIVPTGHFESDFFEPLRHKVIKRDSMASPKPFIPSLLNGEKKSAMGKLHALFFAEQTLKNYP